MAKKQQVTKIEGIEASALTGETVLLWKATRELSAEEHEQLSNKLRLEQEHAGIKIVLVPLSVNIEVTVQTVSDPVAEPAKEPAAESELTTEPEPAADVEPNQGGDEQ